MNKIITEDEDQTRIIAARLAAVIEEGMVVFLQGGLGAGKTTFAQGFLKALGFAGVVKSPTYNIVQPYQTDEFMVYHFDLYRLSDPEELEALGMRDYFDGHSISILEWPEKGTGLLPIPDVCVRLDYVEQGRQVSFNTMSEAGRKIIHDFNH